MPTRINHRSGSAIAAPMVAPWTQSRTADPTTAVDILYLAELVPVVRARFGLDADFPDDAVLASLRSIAVHSDSRERWQAAFRSTLGRWMAQNGRDLNTSLNITLGLLPRPTS